MNKMSEFRFIRITNSDYSFKYKVLKMDFSEERQKFLNYQELNYYNKLKSKKRKAEYMSGRYLTKLLLADMALQRDSISVLNSREPGWYGKPMLYINDKLSKYSISISHESNCFGAVISENAVGIDLMKIRSIELSVLNDEVEMNHWNGNAAFLDCLCWSIRESLTKSLGVGLIYGLNSVKVSKMNFDDETGTLIFNEKVSSIIPELAKINIYYTILDDYLITICEII